MQFKNKAKNKKYRSGSEEKLAKFMQANKLKFKYEPHTLEYSLPPLIRTYLPDFQIGDTYIEFKGRFLSPDRKKLLAVKYWHPAIDLRLVFQADQVYSSKTTKKKLRYSDWAKRHGFPYHIGISLPEAWITELKKNTSDGKKRVG